MALDRWKKLSEKILFTNPWWTYRLDAYRLPGGRQGEYHYVHTEGASMVIPLLGDGRIVLVKQYRYLSDRESLEFPAGGVRPGQTYEQTAIQELAEETGFRAASLDPAGEFNPYNGVTDEICRLFIARGLKAGAVKPDVTEQFEQVLLTPEELENEIQRGTVWDGMTLAGWALARKQLR